MATQQLLVTFAGKRRFIRQRCWGFNYQQCSEILVFFRDLIIKLLIFKSDGVKSISNEAKNECYKCYNSADDF